MATGRITASIFFVKIRPIMASPLGKVKPPALWRPAAIGVTSLRLVRRDPLPALPEAPV